VGAGAAAIDKIYDTYGLHGVPAVGYQSDSVNYAAELPRGFGHLHGYHLPGVAEDGLLVAAALRQGKEPASVMIGVAYPEEARLVIPRLGIIQELAVNVNLPAQYPGVPLG
jgi:hypothetical protein